MSTTMTCEHCQETTFTATCYARSEGAGGGCAGVKKVQVRAVLRGEATVLGDAASDVELFLTEDLVTRYPLSGAAVPPSRLPCPPDFTQGTL